MVGAGAGVGAEAEAGAGVGATEVPMAGGDDVQEMDAAVGVAVQWGPSWLLLGLRLGPALLVEVLHSLHGTLEAGQGPAHQSDTSIPELHVLRQPQGPVVRLPARLRPHSRPRQPAPAIFQELPLRLDPTGETSDGHPRAVCLAGLGGAGQIGR